MFARSNVFIQTSSTKIGVKSSRRPSIRHGGTSTVVMIRHGESIWNLDKRYTGWCDVPLTSHGEADARDAGALIGQRGLKFDVAFTSNLERAWRTCAMVLAESGQSTVETVRTWRLNERHYGGMFCRLTEQIFVRGIDTNPLL